MCLNANLTNHLNVNTTVATPVMAYSKEDDERNCLDIIDHSQETRSHPAETATGTAADNIHQQPDNTGVPVAVCPLYETDLQQLTEREKTREQKEKKKFSGPGPWRPVEGQAGGRTAGGHTAADLSLIHI